MARFSWPLEQMLCPQLRPADVVVMDNLAAHKVEVRYLPPYSPDFNPIEKCRSQVKQRFARGAKVHSVFAREQSLSQALAEGLVASTGHATTTERACRCELSANGTGPASIAFPPESCSPSAGNRVRLHPGTLFAFTPESFSPSLGIRTHRRPSRLPSFEELIPHRWAPRSRLIPLYPKPSRQLPSGVHRGLRMVYEYSEKLVSNLPQPKRTKSPTLSTGAFNF